MDTESLITNISYFASFRSNKDLRWIIYMYIIMTTGCLINHNKWQDINIIIIFSMYKMDFTVDLLRCFSSG